MNPKRLLITTLAALMTLSVGAATFAASTTKATVPVTLTVDQQYRAINVTAPSVLPVEITNGEVITAENAEITNHTKNRAVQVAEISVTDGLLNVDDYDNPSEKRGIALEFNGCATEGEGILDINSTAFPEIESGKSLNLDYDAKVTGVTDSNEINAANVVFTLSLAS